MTKGKKIQKNEVLKQKSKGLSSGTPIEAVAKLPDPEKTMILNQFAGAASALYPAAEHILLVSRARRQGGKMAQKGDFAGAGSFATASVEAVAKL